jgi:hypothetical protein
VGGARGHGADRSVVEWNVVKSRRVRRPGGSPSAVSWRGGCEPHRRAATPSGRSQSARRAQLMALGGPGKTSRGAGVACLCRLRRLAGWLLENDRRWRGAGRSRRQTDGVGVSSARRWPPSLRGGQSASCAGRRTGLKEHLHSEPPAAAPTWPRQRRIVLISRSANFPVLALARVGRSITQGVGMQDRHPNWRGVIAREGSERAAERGVR